MGLNDHDNAQIDGIARRARHLAEVAAEGKAVFDGNADTRLAAEGALVSLGTKAAKLSAEFREGHPGLPLPPVLTARNQLVCTWYTDADTDGLWGSASAQKIRASLRTP